nr:MAG TPA: hypothetical protein [Bacteriophage sp.]
MVNLENLLHNHYSHIHHRQVIPYISLITFHLDISAM